MSVYTFVIMHVPTWSNLFPTGHICVKFCICLKLYKQGSLHVRIFIHMWRYLMELLFDWEKKLWNAYKCW